MQRPWIPDLDPRLRMSRTSVGNDRKRERRSRVLVFAFGAGRFLLGDRDRSYTGSWHEKEKSSHVAAFLLCLGCGHAVRDAGLWMRWLLFMRAEDADEVDFIIRRGSAERPAYRARSTVRLTIAEKLAAPVAGKRRAVTIGPGARALEEHTPASRRGAGAIISVAEAIRIPRNCLVPSADRLLRYLLSLPAR